jgi:hypothetical protein
MAEYGTSVETNAPPEKVWKIHNLAETAERS